MYDDFSAASRKRGKSGVPGQGMGGQQPIGNNGYLPPKPQPVMTRPPVMPGDDAFINPPQGGEDGFIGPPQGQRARPQGFGSEIAPPSWGGNIGPGGQDAERAAAGGGMLGRMGGMIGMPQRPGPPPMSDIPQMPTDPYITPTGPGFMDARQLPDGSAVGRDDPRYWGQQGPMQVGAEQMQPRPQDIAQRFLMSRALRGGFGDSGQMPGWNGGYTTPIRDPRF